MIVATFHGLDEWLCGLITNIKVEVDIKRVLVGLIHLHLLGIAIDFSLDFDNLLSERLNRSNMRFDGCGVGLDRLDMRFNGFPCSLEIAFEAGDFFTS